MWQQLAAINMMIYFRKSQYKRNRRRLEASERNRFVSPSKWKKWLSWLRRRRASAPRPTARLSGLASLASLSTRYSPSPMFSDNRHVGQDVSCSSQERRHELRTQHDTLSKCHNRMKHKSHLPVIRLDLLI